HKDTISICLRLDRILEQMFVDSLTYVKHYDDKMLTSPLCLLFAVATVFSIDAKRNVINTERSNPDRSVGRP
ncbi:24767_t:CDS:2, partial [Racocetra persica]